MRTRNHLYIGVATAALVLAAGSAFGQTVPVVPVNQAVTNNGAVSNGGKIDSRGDLSIGSSLSIGATGAVASVSVSGINGAFTNTAGSNNLNLQGSFGTISQTATNTGDVKNFKPATGAGSATANIIDLGNSKADIGIGASVSVSATGAAAAISVSGIADAVNYGLSYILPGTGAITQTAANRGSITNIGEIQNAKNLKAGASASIAATGAAASTSLSVVNAAVSSSTIGNITQSVTNDPSTAAGANTPAITITNTGKLQITGDLGRGASASVSASGAVASVSFRAHADEPGGTNTAPSVTIPTIGTITQGTAATPIKNNSTVTNNGQIDGTVGKLAEGASVSIGATGAAASVGLNTITVASLAGSTVGAIGQSVRNEGSVTNNVTGNLTVGDLAPGASASFSASGAVASVGASFIKSAWKTPGTGMTFGNINQTVANTGAVKNNDSNQSITTGKLDTGASASIGASGAVASASYSSIAGTSANPSATFGTITQTATNGGSGNPASGAVTNHGTITVANIAGQGASASVSATGAAASFSYASIADAAPMGGAKVNASTTQGITQTVNNYANVTNTGAITINGGGLPAGASASISATGAAAVVSFTSVR